jgi:hypothetical protein
VTDPARGPWHVVSLAAVRYLGLAILLCLSGVSELHAQRIATPPDDTLEATLTAPCPAGSRGRTVMVQLGGGLAAGTLAVMGSKGALMLIESVIAVASGNENTDLGRVTWLTMYPTYVLGSAVAVHWIGRGRGYGGRLFPTLLGSALGLGSPGATLVYHLSDRPPDARECEEAAELFRSPPTVVGLDRDGDGDLDQGYDNQPYGTARQQGQAHPGSSGEHPGQS